MNVGLGIGLIVSGCLLAFLVIGGAWRRLQPAVALGLLSGCGIAVGVGGLLVQDDAGPGSWILTCIALGALTPIHARLVFGRPGRTR